MMEMKDGLVRRVHEKLFDLIFFLFIFKGIFISLIFLLNQVHKRRLTTQPN